MKKKGIGLDVKPPDKACSDPKCPFHGTASIRGRLFLGVVSGDKMTRTVTVEWVRRIYVPKYERYEKRKSKLKAHNPDCINAKKGDVVMIAETLPLSKTKHFVVVEVVGRKSKREVLKEEAVAEAAKELAKGAPGESAEKSKAQKTVDDKTEDDKPGDKKK